LAIGKTERAVKHLIRQDELGVGEGGHASDGAGMG
jgi:hypothetical protein